MSEKRFEAQAADLKTNLNQQGIKVVCGRSQDRKS